MPTEFNFSFKKSNLVIGFFWFLAITAVIHENCFAQAQTKQLKTTTQQVLKDNTNNNTAGFATIYASHGNVKMTVYKREISEGKTIFKSIEKEVKNGDVVPVGAVVSTAENSFATIALGQPIDTQNLATIALKEKTMAKEFDQTQIVKLLGSLATLAAKSSIKILSLPNKNAKTGIELQLLSGQVDNRVLTDPNFNNIRSSSSNSKQISSTTQPYYQVRAKLVTASVRGTHFRVSIPTEEKVASSVIEGLVDIGTLKPNLQINTNQKLANEFNQGYSATDFGESNKMITSLAKNTGIVLSEKYLLNDYQNKDSRQLAAATKELLTAPIWINPSQLQNLPQIVLTWQPLKNINKYRVQVASDSLFLDLLDQKDIVLDNKDIGVNPLKIKIDSLPAADYYARVSAFDEDLVEGNYSVIKFKRSSYNLITSSKALNNEGLIHFSWNQLPVKSYQFIVKPQSSKEPVIHIKDIQKQSLELSIGSLPPGKYEWYVVAKVAELDQELEISSKAKKFVVGN
jgi:hypothetical protein